MDQCWSNDSPQAPDAPPVEDDAGDGDKGEDIGPHIEAHSLWLLHCSLHRPLNGIRHHLLQAPQPSCL